MAESKLQRDTRVLILEDNVRDADEIRAELLDPEWPFKTIRAGSREEFTRLLTEFVPDVVLARFDLADINAPSAIDMARQIYPGIPFIVVTDAIGDDAVARCFRAGADDIVLKPDLHTLRPAIRLAMDRAARHARLTRLEALAGSIDDLVDILDFNGTRLWSSPSYRTYVGEPASLEGRPFLDQIHPDDRDRVAEIFNQTISAGVGQRVEYRLFCADKMTRHVECQMNLLQDASPPMRLVVVSRVISKRKRAEDALRENVKHFRALVENISDAISLINPYGIVLYTSRSTRRVLGYYMNEFVGRNIFELIHPEDLAHAISHFNTLKQKSYSTTYFQFRMRHKDATWHWMEGVGNNLMADPSVKAIVFNYRDITTRKQAEEELKQSEERYREMFKKNQAIKLLIDPATAEIIDANSAAADFYGYGIDELKELLITDIDTQPSEDVMREIGRAALEQQTYHSAQHRMRDGRIRRVDIYSSPITAKSRRLLYSIIHDVTERYEATQQLSAEKERLLVTLRSIGEGVITTDTNGKMVLMNRVAENLTGWTQEEAFGMPIETILSLVTADHSGRISNPVEAVLATGQPTSDIRPIILQARSGKECRIVESAAPIVAEDGAFIGVVLVIRDISERLKMEEELQKVRNIESIGILAGGIAHDFNNILSAILGNITLAKLKLETSGKEKITEFLTSSEKAALRAKHLTQQLLTFSKGGSPVKKTASISELLKESASFSLTGSNVRSQCMIADDLWAVEIDEGQMNQVINNMVINAQQAMPEGGIIRLKAENVVVETEHETLGLPAGFSKFVRISIEDQGSGIRQEHLSKIFDPYFTTKDTGSGLGLATSYSIIRNHQGAITVESEWGKGTTFHIYLPAAKSAAVMRPGLDHLGTNARRVLVMDDEDDIRMMATHMLEHLGYDGLAARNGEETIETFQSARRGGNPIDLVIMDLTIPGGLGGKETVRRLQEIDPNVRVVVSSGYSQDPVMSEYRKYGFTNVLPKPYHLEDLSRLLKNLFPDGGT